METFAKAVLTSDADRDLALMVKKTNDGFTSGKLTKNQLLSWIVCSFRRKYFEREKEQIRAEHFDKIATAKSKSPKDRIRICRERKLKNSSK